MHSCLSRERTDTACSEPPANRRTTEDGNATQLVVKFSREAHESEAPEVRVRVKIMGSPKCGNVGESQPVLIMIDPIICPRTRIAVVARREYGEVGHPDTDAERRVQSPKWRVLESQHAVGSCAADQHIFAIDEF